MKQLIAQSILTLKEFYHKPAGKKWVIFFFVFSLLCVAASINRVIIYMSDFNMFLDPAVDAKFHDIDPFDKWTNNSYPPFFYGVMSILAPFARWFAVLIWSCVSLASLFLVFSVGRNFLATQFKPNSHYLLITLVLSGVFIFDNLQLGQSNIAVMILVCTSLFYLQKGKNLTAGFFLGFAIAFKTVPLVFLGLLFLNAKFKSIVYSLGFFLLLSFAVPLLFYSPSKTVAHLNSWTESVIGPFFTGEKLKTTTVTAYSTNQSYDAFLGRHLTQDGVEKYQLDERPIFNLPLFSSEQLKLPSYLLKLLLMLFVTFIVMRLRQRNQSNLWVEASLFFYLILFLSPVAWVNYYIYLIPLVLSLLAIKKETIRKFNLTTVLFWLGFLLIVIGATDRYFQTLSLYFLGGLLLFSSLSIELLKLPKKNTQI